MYLHEIILQMLLDENWELDESWELDDDLSQYALDTIVENTNKRIKEAYNEWNGFIVNVELYITDVATFTVQGIPGEWTLHFEPGDLQYDIVYEKYEDIE